MMTQVMPPFNWKKVINGMTKLGEIEKRIKDSKIMEKTIKKVDIENLHDFLQKHYPSLIYSYKQEGVQEFANHVAKLIEEHLKFKEGDIKAHYDSGKDSFYFNISFSGVTAKRFFDKKSHERKET